MNLYLEYIMSTEIKNTADCVSVKAIIAPFKWYKIVRIETKITVAKLIMIFTYEYNLISPSPFNTESTNRLRA